MGRIPVTPVTATPRTASSAEADGSSSADPPTDLPASAAAAPEADAAAPPAPPAIVPRMQPVLRQGSSSGSLIVDPKVPGDDTQTSACSRAADPIEAPSLSLNLLRRRWQAAETARPAWRSTDHKRRRRRGHRRTATDDDDEEGCCLTSPAFLCACAIILLGVVLWIGLVVSGIVYGLMYVQNKTVADLRAELQDLRATHLHEGIAPWQTAT